MTSEEAPPDVGPGAFDEHLPIPSTRAAIARLAREDLGSGGLTVALLTGATLLLELLGDFGAVLGAALVAGYLLAVIRSAAHGAPQLPDSADFAGLESWLVPLGQAALAFAPSIALVAWDYAQEGPSLVLASLSIEPPFRWTAWRWGLAGAGLLLAPPGVLTAAITEHPLAPLYVVLNARLALRLPGLCGRVAVCLLVGFLLATALFEVPDALRGGGQLVAASRAVVRFVGLGALTVVAFAIGWTVYRQADALGLPRRPEHVRRHYAYAPRP